MASYNFGNYGPYKLERKGGVTADDLNECLSTVEEEAATLLDAIGVHIFAVKSTKNSKLKPWYVGKTDKGFRKRLTTHQRSGTIFGDIAKKAPNGHLYVLLIPRLTPGNKFRKSAKKTLGSINSLEDALIGSCLQVNPKLANASKTRFFRNLSVPGYLHSGKIKKSETGALVLKELLG